MTTFNCATKGISAYVPSSDTPWTKTRAAHLLRRIGYGATLERIDEALAQNPKIFIQEIVNNAQNQTLPEKPNWADWSLSNYEADPIPQILEQIYSIMIQWQDDMVKKGFLEKMTLFWSNHFVTRLEDYNCPSYLYKYYTLLQTHALGNFKDFVYEIGKTPAMLIFLNGIQNTKFQPNENYARELYELFTLGHDNGYTQADIVDTAKALTGWNGFIEACAPLQYSAFTHDTSEKTIFGRTGNWGYDDLHDILFEERGQEIATYICTKLYKYFICHEVDHDIVAELATTFQVNNFEIKPVILQLLQSEHFFDDANINVKIKSPTDYIFSMIKELEFPYTNDQLVQIYYANGEIGQILFDPIDVAGWKGNRAWVNSDYLTSRWQIADFILFGKYEINPDFFREFAKKISNNSKDPKVITKIIVDYFINGGVNTQEAYDTAELVFRGEIPDYYFTSGIWDLDFEYAPGQTALLMRHIFKLPEFQLM